MRNKKLVKLHPYLLPRNVWTGKIVRDYDYTYTEYDCISKGWQIGFGKFFLEDLREACLKTNFLDNLQFTQIKEKYGRLCLYNNGAPQEVHDVLYKYEFISQYICYNCGSPNACVVDDYGWYLPICECCWDKFNKKREAKGYKIMSWEDAVGENQIGLPNEYRIERYSKGKEETITYDISETANKIRNRYNKKIKRK
jgi:hypothetical protein